MEETNTENNVTNLENNEPNKVTNSQEFMNNLVGGFVEAMEKQAKPIQEAISDELQSKERALALLNDYEKTQDDITSLNSKIIEIKNQHPEIFNEIDKINNQIELLNSTSDKIKECILDEIRKFKSVLPLHNKRFKVTYTPATVRRVFDTKKFYATYTPTSALYKTYVRTTDVTDYIKIQEVK